MSAACVNARDLESTTAHRPTLNGGKRRSNVGSIRAPSKQGLLHRGLPPTIEKSRKVKDDLNVEKPAADLYGVLTSLPSSRGKHMREKGEERLRETEEEM